MEKASKDISNEPLPVYPEDKYFMDKVFKELQAKKGGEYPFLPSDTVFKGYKTIHIQKLDVKKPSRNSFHTNGRQPWWLRNVKKMLCYEESCQFSIGSKNGFFQALYEAYINHGDIKITPDDVWTTIMIYFSKYVDLHAEQLRKAFVSHQGKQEIIVDTYEPEEKWDEFFNKVIGQIAKNTTEGVVDDLACNFSSTNRFFRFMSTASIMSSFRKYFDWSRNVCVCGVQNIHMGGNLQDWVNICQKASGLIKYDVNGELKGYVKGIVPILEQFVETYKGRPHLQFWNNIYQERKNPRKTAYSPSIHRNGWLIKFFTTKNELGDQVQIEQIEVPIKIDNKLTGQVKQVHLTGGTKGVSIEDDHIYRPHFSFAIVERKTKEQQEKSREWDEQPF